MEARLRWFTCFQSRDKGNIGRERHCRWNCHAGDLGKRLVKLRKPRDELSAASDNSAEVQVSAKITKRHHMKNIEML